MAITGGSWANCWCAQIGPGGLPSIGPVPPPSAGSTGCCVVFAWAVGAGVKTETGCRGNTSKRGIGVENACTPNKGLGGSPVGMLESANALRAKGLSPLIGTSRPAPVNSPILIKSRRETCPWECALMISQRFFRAFSASRSRALDALGDKKKFLSDIFSPFRCRNSEVFADSGTGEGSTTQNHDQIRTNLMWLCSVNDAPMTRRSSASKPSSDFKPEGASIQRGGNHEYQPVDNWWKRSFFRLVQGE